MLQTRLTEFLVKEGIIKRDVLAQYERMVPQDHPWRLGEVLIKAGALSDDVLKTSISTITGSPVVSLSQLRIPAYVAKIIKRADALEYLIIPVALKNEGGREALYMAFFDPSEPALLEQVRKLTKYEVKIIISGYKDIVGAIDKYLKNTGNTNARIQAPQPETRSGRIETASPSPRGAMASDTAIRRSGAAKDDFRVDLRQSGAPIAGTTLKFGAFAEPEKASESEIPYIPPMADLPKATLRNIPIEPQQADEPRGYQFQPPPDVNVGVQSRKEAAQNPYDNLARERRPTAQTRILNENELPEIKQYIEPARREFSASSLEHSMALKNSEESQLVVDLGNEYGRGKRETTRTRADRVRRENEEQEQIVIPSATSLLGLQQMSDGGFKEQNAQARKDFPYEDDMMNLPDEKTIEEDLSLDLDALYSKLEPPKPSLAASGLDSLDVLFGNYKKAEDRTENTRIKAIKKGSVAALEELEKLATEKSDSKKLENEEIEYIYDFISGKLQSAGDENYDRLAKMLSALLGMLISQGRIKEMDFVKEYFKKKTK